MATPLSKSRATETRDSPQKSTSALPTLSLPKGGGAIRGMGEKFGVNPVTGTGSMTIPIAVSPGRSGFGPELSLSYDSGSGNGPFGFGWHLSIPSITRKTDKGLPKYDDAAESDVFILSGAEDLVPVLGKDGKPLAIPSRTIATETGPATYTIKRYRPRIEGLFARIERWTNSIDASDVFWRSISKDNITTWYGKTAKSRITDPLDPRRIFSWLICQSYNDKGNVIVYKYASEDSAGIDRSLAHERNRTDKGRSANRYLKRILYSNETPNRDEYWNATDPSSIKKWFFEAVFDYASTEQNGAITGQHFVQRTPDGDGRVFIEKVAKDNKCPWSMRSDPFSQYRAGFEVRTYRLCRRVIMFHHFPDDLGGIADYPVRSTEFNYNESGTYSCLTSVVQSGFVLHGNNRFLKKSLPPLEFHYSPVPDEKELMKRTVRQVSPESLENLPAGLDGSAYQWIDLDGDGVAGILTEQGGQWFYKRNRSPLPIKDAAAADITRARFAPMVQVVSRPEVSIAAGYAQFMDLAGDGKPDVVTMSGPVRGFFERGDETEWEPFRPFTSWPNVDTHDHNLRFVDLTGDGHADILITGDNIFTWYPSLAEEGFGSSERVSMSIDEEHGPALVFADASQSIYLADLSGDGLTDLVRIRNGEVCYWPNLGYGKFDAKVTMDNSPWFDHTDQFDQKRIRLADIDGSGTVDIIYLHRDGVRIYFNESGNRWSDPVTLPAFPAIDNLAAITVTDLMGNGTACIVWSSPLPGNSRSPMRYIDLMDGQKPHLLVKTINNLGAEIVVQYASSTKYYLLDKEAGTPWITRLPFPVHVVERVITFDRISRNRFVASYTYHHGYFDGEEREFRGFGRVDQRDTEAFGIIDKQGLVDDADKIDEATHVPPVLTRSWFHTGAYIEGKRISRQFEAEYYREPAMQGDAENAGEVESYLKNKFTNNELYNYMVSQVSSLYFGSYQLAFDLAKRAEMAFRYELGLQNSNYIKFGYWDSLKKGLLAGEKLHLDLKRMENAFIEKNCREFEITKHVSLAQINPIELLNLRHTGECYLYIPEELFDLDYPGHYMRRLKSVSITIPCVTGPFSGINCTLSLLKSSVRNSCELINGTSDGYLRDPNNDNTRFTDSLGAIQSIVTSSGQNDNGLFEANFRDERYLPFEGCGAINSSWRLELSKEFRLFDYETISDIILHLRYTARDGGEVLKKAATENLNKYIKGSSAIATTRLFWIRHEFANEWIKFKNTKVNLVGDEKLFAELTLNFKPEHYPFWSKEKLNEVVEGRLFIETDNEVTVYEKKDGTGKTDTLNSYYGKLRGGLLKYNKPLKPTDQLTLYFNDNSMNELWVAIQCKNSPVSP